MRGALWVVLLLGASQALSGCVAAAALPAVALGAANSSNDEEAIKVKTAEHFGTSPRNVQITNYKNQFLATTYQARVKGTLYNCRFYQLSVSCGRPGQGSF